MNLVIDVGNTQIKIGVYDGHVLVHRENFDVSNWEAAFEKLYKEFHIEKGILSHVSRLDTDVINELKGKLDVMLLDRNTKVPFENLYSTPDTLGVDRIALAAASATKHPGEPVLVIDAGTCITFDFVNKNNQYTGGSISPGIQMRYRAVNEFTANLPLLTPENEIPELGDSTDRAIHKGILGGVVNEIDGVIEEYTSKNETLTVVLTGGDANFLANNIKSGIFATPNFLLDGLNSILIHNLAE
jgi:type III pantothenate kinase